MKTELSVGIPGNFEHLMESVALVIQREIGEDVVTDEQVAAMVTPIASELDKRFEDLIGYRKCLAEKELFGEQGFICPEDVEAAQKRYDRVSNHFNQLHDALEDFIQRWSTSQQTAAEENAQES